MEEQSFFTIEGGPTHDPLRVVRSQVGEEIYSQYFKFAFVRNPWDWFVSLYAYFSQMTPAHRWYKNNTQVVHKVRSFRGFEQFCAGFEWSKLKEFYSHGVCHFLEQSHYITDENGVPAVDFIGRFENLQQDWNTVCERMGVAAPLPHNNATKRDGYQQYYTPETRQIVADLYRKDIEMFGYAFD